MEQAFGLEHIEVWRFVKSYEGMYKVSNLGRVMNARTGRILKAGTSNMGYQIVSLRKNSKSSTKKIHRIVCQAFLTNPENKRCTDHINHNRADNNLLNLRYATHQENSRNMSLKTSNTSGVIGVYFNKKRKKYHAQIRLNGKTTHIGYYKTLSEAKARRKLVATEYYGEFANNKNL